MFRIVCDPQFSDRRTVHTHHWFKITLPKHRLSTRKTSVNN